MKAWVLAWRVDRVRQVARFDDLRQTERLYNYLTWTGCHLVQGWEIEWDPPTEVVGEVTAAMLLDPPTPLWDSRGSQARLTRRGFAKPTVRNRVRLSLPYDSVRLTKVTLLGEDYAVRDLVGNPLAVAPSRAEAFAVLGYQAAEQEPYERMEVNR